MKNKSTPGPWTLSGLAVLSGGNNPRIAEAWPGDRPWEETNANARLIAAAPLLLHAAKETVAAIAGARGAIGDVAHLVNTLELLEAAIARAGGGIP